MFKEQLDLDGSQIIEAYSQYPDPVKPAVKKALEEATKILPTRNQIIMDRHVWRRFIPLQEKYKQATMKFAEILEPELDHEIEYSSETEASIKQFAKMIAGSSCGEVKVALDKINGSF